MKFSYLLFALVFGLFLVSCGETFDCEELELNIGDSCDDGDAATENDTVTSNCGCSGTAIGTDITYTNTIKAIIDGSCAVSGCHTDAAMTGGFSLETYAQSSAAAGFGRMIGAINYETDFKAMPPAGQLSQTAIDNITTWINNGTPE